jgi:glycosyltransferase involved in cell wall biosynthesis
VSAPANIVNSDDLILDPEMNSISPKKHFFEVIVASPGGLFGRGGMASVTRTIAEWISASNRGIRIHVVDPRGIGSPWLWPVYFCGTAVRIVALGLKPGPKILHLQVSERSSFIRKGLLQSLGHSLGMTTILHHHGAELIPFYQSTSALMRWWTHRTICRADLNIVLGQRWRNFLLNEVGTDPDRISVLYNASADLKEPVEAARSRLRKTAPETEAFHFLVVANLSPRKGISEFLNAIHRLREDGLKVQATLAGGGEIARYTAEARTLGLETACRFTGWVDRSAIMDLLASADSLVLPSYEEGLPMVILEALSCHLPVIATPVGSIGELLTSESDCLLVPPGDIDGLASALRRVATEEKLRRQMIDNGRKLFERHFQLDQYMGALLKHYATVL